MYRTSMLRSLTLLLLVGLGLCLSDGVASSQEKPRSMVISVGEVKRVEMSKKQAIMTASSEKPAIVQIEAIKDVANAVFLTGKGAGSAKVSLTDGNMVTEVIDVTVTSEKRQEFLEQVAKTYPGAKEINVVQTTKATTVTGVAPDSRTIKSITELAKSIFPDAVVALNLPEGVRNDFEQLIAKTVPGARVTVFAAGGNVVVSGTAPNDAAVRTIAQASRNTFGEDVVLSVQIAGEEYTRPVPRVQQVELEVIVAVVDRSEVRRLSFNWVENRKNYFIGSLLGPTNALGGLSFVNSLATGVSGASQAAAGNPNLQFGIVGDRGSFLGFLEALRTEGLAKIMSEPRIVAMAGRKTQNAQANANVPANGNVGSTGQGASSTINTAGTSTSNRPYILSGGETPVIIPSSPGSPPTVQYKQFGTRVEFEPVVLTNGKIQLDIAAELSNKNDANGIFVQGIQVPGFDSRKAETSVIIEDGQTLAIGGLIQNSVSAQSNKVPVLGDIPFLGTAFTSTFYSEKEEELIVLVTPRLVDPMNCTQLPRRLPGRETRSPDDFELFLTQILEAPRGQREVFPDGRYQGPHMNGPTAGVYPCGDNGHGRGCASGNCNTGTVSGRYATTPPAGNQVPVNQVPVNQPMETPAAAPLPNLPGEQPPASEIPLPPDGRPVLPPSLNPLEGNR
jgi:pilus assembly protein CpaC